MGTVARLMQALEASLNSRQNALRIWNGLCWTAAERPAFILVPKHYIDVEISTVSEWKAVWCSCTAGSHHPRPTQKLLQSYTKLTSPRYCVTPWARNSSGPTRLRIMEP